MSKKVNKRLLPRLELDDYSFSWCSKESNLEKKNISSENESSSVCYVVHFNSVFHIFYFMVSVII
ncbi:hypothetical protein PGB90_006197 [Kerria lacca]